MNRIVHLITGGLTTVLFVTAAAWFSSRPAVRVLPDGSAMVKISFSHGGNRKCRTLTADERSRLPANMRRRTVCERRRAPLYLELDIDGATVLARTLPPTGISGDGASRIYEKFVLPAGRHDIAVRLRVGGAAGTFDHRAARTVTLAPAQVLPIDFRPRAGGFVFD